MEEIRERMPTLIASLIAIIICIAGCYFLENHEDVFYTQIDNSKIVALSATDSMNFEYTLDCYNEKGKKKELKFKTSRELREDAYIMLKVRVMGVHSWEEVDYKSLPEKVKNNY